jgi:hypothetical protein
MKKESKKAESGMAEEIEEAMKLIKGSFGGRPMKGLLLQGESGGTIAFIEASEVVSWRMSGNILGITMKAWKCHASDTVLKVIDINKVAVLSIETTNPDF